MLASIGRFPAILKFAEAVSYLNTYECRDKKEAEDWMVHPPIGTLSYASTNILSDDPNQK